MYIFYRYIWEEFLLIFRSSQASILCIRSWECINTGNWYSHRHHNRVLKSNWGWQNCLVVVPTIGSRDSPGTIKAMAGKRGWRKHSLSGRIPLLRRMEQEQQRGGLHLLGSRSHTNLFSFAFMQNGCKSCLAWVRSCLSWDRGVCFRTPYPGRGWWTQTMIMHVKLLCTQDLVLDRRKIKASWDRECKCFFQLGKAAGFVCLSNMFRVLLTTLKW